MYSVSIPIKHRGNSIYAKPITTFLQKEICKSLLNESNDAHIVLTFNKILEECLSISTDVLCLNIIEFGQ